MKIARVATVPFFLYNHLRGQIIATVEAGHEAVLISSAGPEVELLKTIPGVRFHEIDIPRRISPIRDLKALWQLYLFFCREKFDIVHSTTPKAGMLCAIAAYLAKVPIRLHTFTGQAWVELRGMTRFLAKSGDKATAFFDTQCYADSHSQKQFMLSEGIASDDKMRVLGAGSLAGVDITRFNTEKWINSRASMRRELKIPDGNKIITFIGRITRDKGIEELILGFEQLRSCTLLLIGPEEEKLGTIIDSAMRKDSNIRMIGYSSEPERYLAVTDIFCLPSYREGFGNVVIEAAAMGVPTVGTNIVGLRDAVVDGETGILVPPKDVDSLAKALMDLLEDDEKRLRLGKNAQTRAVNMYDSRRVNDAVLKEYGVLWQNRGGA